LLVRKATTVLTVLLQVATSQQSHQLAVVVAVSKTQLTQDYQAVRVAAVAVAVQPIAVHQVSQELVAQIKVLLAVQATALAVIAQAAVVAVLVQQGQTRQRLRLVAQVA
jgi:CO/xanthine dehydrogenase FAD-binding subunit